MQQLRVAIASVCVIGFCSTQTVNADEKEGFLCKYAENERLVEVQYPDSPELLPCEVVYYRRTEEPDAGGEILWSADYDRAFCTAKLQVLVERLERSGWLCAGDG